MGCHVCPEEGSTPEGLYIWGKWGEKIKNYAAGHKCVKAEKRELTCKISLSGKQPANYQTIMKIFEDCGYDKRGLTFLSDDSGKVLCSGFEKTGKCTKR